LKIDFDEAAQHEENWKQILMKQRSAKKIEKRF
jgi:hypothetical protein